MNADRYDIKIAINIRFRFLYFLWLGLGLFTFVFVYSFLKYTKFEIKVNKFCVVIIAVTVVRSYVPMNPWQKLCNVGKNDVFGEYA